MLNCFKYINSKFKVLGLGVSEDEGRRRRGRRGEKEEKHQTCILMYYNVLKPFQNILLTQDLRCLTFSKLNKHTLK